MWTRAVSEIPQPYLPSLGGPKGPSGSIKDAAVYNHSTAARRMLCSIYCRGPLMLCSIVDGGGPGRPHHSELAFFQLKSEPKSVLRSSGKSLIKGPTVRMTSPTNGSKMR